jgi:vacuolar iron transporter family protein
MTSVDKKEKKEVLDEGVLLESNEEKTNAEFHEKGAAQYIGDYVFGALDGIITTFAVVSGVQGAQLSNSIVLILGFANLLGDGISMAVGSFLSAKSEIEYQKRERKREELEIINDPKSEIAEIREIYSRKGFTGKDLDRAVEIITSDKKIWLDTMMLEELNLIKDDKTPLKSSIATFIAFVIAGFIPLLAFVLAQFFEINNLFLVSIVLTGLTLFSVGAAKTYVTKSNWIKSGFEMLVVGGLAAGVAYFIGFFLKGMGL